MRRRSNWGALVLALFLAPPLTYEALEKSHDHLRRPSVLHRLSARAELETPWRPRTGRPWLDHALHELQETRRFYLLAGRRLVREWNQPDLG